MATNVEPKLLVEIGFASDPTTALGSTTWTDVTDYVNACSGKRCGRQYELDQFQAGSATVELDNADRRFEPGNPSSPYYPNVLPLRRIRITSGENAVSNPSFETNTTGWAAKGSGSIARTTAVPLIGFGACQVTPSTAAADGIIQSAGQSLTAGVQYTVNVYVVAPAGLGCTLAVMDSAGTSVQASQTFTGDGNDHRISVSFTPGSTATYKIAVFRTSTGTAADVMIVDAFQIVVGAAQPYIDAPTALFSGFVERWPIQWDGPQDSTMQIPCTDAFEVLANLDVVTPHASYLQVSAGSNNDLTVSAVTPGTDGNLLSVRFRNDGTNPPTFTNDVTPAGEWTLNYSPTLSTAAAAAAAINATSGTSGMAASYEGNGSGIVLGTALTRHMLTGGGWAAELAGARVTRILDVGGWPSADRSIDTGNTTIADTGIVSVDGVKALNQLQDVEEAEGGQLYVDGNGKVVFQDRTHRTTSVLSTVVQVTFTDFALDTVTQNTFPFSEAQPSLDKDLVVNEVNITSAQTGATTQTVSDATSQTRYFKRSLTKSIHANSDADALAIANQILNGRKTPSLRYDHVVVDVWQDDGDTWAGLFNQTLRREISDRIQINATPQAPGDVGSTIAMQAFVESIEFDIAPGALFSMTFEVSPISVTTGSTSGGGGGGGTGSGGADGWILDDAAKSQLDSTAVLA